MKRRAFLCFAGAALAHRAVASHLLDYSDIAPSAQQKADHALRIEPCTIDIGKGVSIRTVAYNGQVPGPLLRMREGVPVSIEVTNATSTSDLVHWHGLAIDSLNDGAMEEGSPMIQPGRSLRYTFTPRPSGTRWYHTHATAEGNLALGTYTGQFGFLLVDKKQDPARYDQEFNLAIHHWEPSFVPMVQTIRERSANMPLTSGSDVGYKYATINSHMLGAGEPLRVQQGQRVLMRLLNASATENVILALPGHTFTVIAMDGNVVPSPKKVEVLSLAVAERIDAVVEMNAPGKWILGSILEKERAMGLGVVVEYAGSSGAPMWKNPTMSEWDYTQFGKMDEVPEPEKSFELIFRDVGSVDGSPFDTWTINGKAWPHTDPLEVVQGKRYRLVFRNGSGDQHPMHLHRHSFEVTQVGGRRMSGLMKDVINVMPMDSVAVDFVADNPGDTLMHCHQQLHMDFGFMQLVKYVG